MTVNQDEDHPENGTITARLIDGSDNLDQAVHASIDRYKGMTPPHDNFDNCMVKHQGHHKHQGEIQVFDGTNDGDGLIALKKGEDVAIGIDNRNKNYVKVLDSYDKFMPKLLRIANSLGLPVPPAFNDDFISHTVTINRGVVRVREVGDWDGGSIAIPAILRDGEAVYQPAKVRFLNANVYGYVATECVVEVEDANSVTIAGPSQLKRKYTGKSMASRRVAEDTVEILITNYAPQQAIALPWTLHYRWMFEAAGYTAPIALGGPELDALKSFGKAYDKESWVCESEMFLGPDGDERGYPFPYRTVARRGNDDQGGGPDMWIVRLGDLAYNQPFHNNPGVIPNPQTPAFVGTDPWDPVRCPMGDFGGK